MVLVNFWRYPDPYQRFLIRIRIRIRPNDTDPTGSGSGSETLVWIVKLKLICAANYKITLCSDWGDQTIAWMFFRHLKYSYKSITTIYFQGERLFVPAGPHLSFVSSNSRAKHVGPTIQKVRRALPYHQSCSPITSHLKLKEGWSK